MTKLFCVAALAGLSLASCAPKEVVRDVEYFNANTEERSQVLAECEKNPGEARASANCTNAATSKFKSGLKATSMSKIK